MLLGSDISFALLNVNWFLQLSSHSLDKPSLRLCVRELYKFWGMNTKGEATLVSACWASSTLSDFGTQNCLIYLLWFYKMYFSLTSKFTIILTNFLCKNLLEAIKIFFKVMLTFRNILSYFIHILGECILNYAQKTLCPTWVSSANVTRDSL